MPITSSATRALRKDIRRTVVNRRTKNRMKLSVKTFLESKTSDALSAAVSNVDKAVKKHLIHWKKAARMKAQLQRQLSQAVSTPTKAKAKPAAKKAKTSKKTAVKKARSAK